MKKVLIFPRFLQMGTQYRAFVTSSLGEFLLSKNISPIIPFYSTEISTMEEAQRSAKHLWDQYSREVDGVLFQGGNDLDPQFYGEENTHALGIQFFRDAVEYACMEIFLVKNIPIFGICRGMQLLNVVCGGSLYQDLEVSQFSRHMNTTEPGKITEEDMAYVQEHKHIVRFQSGGVLASLYGEIELEVNSYHHQGVARVGAGLFVEARSEEHVVEALSFPGKNILGVQWHPELEFSRKEYHEPLEYWLNKL